MSYDNKLGKKPQRHVIDSVRVYISKDVVIQIWWSNSQDKVYIKLKCNNIFSKSITKSWT